MGCFFVKKTKKTILELGHWFDGGKIVLGFYNYDETKPKGSKMTGNVQIYLNMLDALHIGHMLSDSVVHKGITYSPFLLRAKKVEAEKTGQYADPVYKAEPMGSTRNGKIYARQFLIQSGIKTPLVLRAMEGPGEKNETGGYVPQYKYNTAENSVVIGLTETESIKLGLSIIKAVDVYYALYGKSFLEEDKIMNNVVLIGRLTKDPEVRYTQSQMAVAKFTLAVDRPVKSGGEKQADFPRVTCFGKTAELVEKYLSKGRQVSVQGRLQTGSYQDSDGKTVFTTDVIADRVEFLGSSEKSTGTAGTRPAEGPAAAFTEMDDEDIPF